MIEKSSEYDDNSVAHDKCWVFTVLVVHTH